jgi:hypothetical protein
MLLLRQSRRCRSKVESYILLYWKCQSSLRIPPCQNRTTIWILFIYEIVCSRPWTLFLWQRSTRHSFDMVSMFMATYRYSFLMLLRIAHVIGLQDH